jgi:crotonobetainyl-CoA:carnitine CoA-transferase CaiB-like acyl-CoA transferase
VVLDLADPGDQRLASELATRADVLVENMMPGRMADNRFATNSARVRHRDELRELLTARLGHLGKAQALRLFREAGVPAGPVNNMDEAFDFARTLNLDVTWNVDGVPQVRTPFELSATPPRPTLGAPALDGTGEDIRQWLASSHRRPRPAVGGPGQRRTPG